MFILLHRSHQWQAVHNSRNHCHQSHFARLFLCARIFNNSFSYKINTIVAFKNLIFGPCECLHTSHILLRKSQFERTTGEISPTNTSPFCQNNLHRNRIVKMDVCRLGRERRCRALLFIFKIKFLHKTNFFFLIFRIQKIFFK